MVFLITFELLTLQYTVQILSSVRAFVAGEGLWSKAQKNALIEMQNYIIFKDEKYYKAFLEQMAIPLGDRVARIELGKKNPDYQLIRESFLKGRNHSRDIEGMTKLIERFSSISYVSNAIEAWVQGDLLIDELLKRGEDVHKEVQSTPKGHPLKRQEERFGQISEINTRITFYADRFSSLLGEASRWVEEAILLMLILVVLIVEGSGLFFTFRFSQTLIRNLKDLNTSAKKIGTGDFSQRTPIHSKDELGQLANSLNRMAKNLQDISVEKINAEQTNQTKSLFLANMSHEIRTPLGAILGFVDLLKDADLSIPERKSYLNIVSKAGDALVTIINDILDLSKVEAGKIEISKEVFSLPNLLRDFETLLRIRSEDKGIDLHFERASNAPEFVYSDPARIRQILLNIVGNAIKFTDKGTVDVKVASNNDFLIFDISDTGSGISPEEVSKLFTPFTQGDQSVKKTLGGTGLGLALAKSLAQLLGGDVILKSSTPGKGTVFQVSVPFQIPEDLKGSDGTAAKVKPGINSTAIDGNNILIVEDSPDNQLLLSRILLKGGAQVKVAQNGQIGLEMALGEDFDIIIMDMQMPVLDGYSAIRLLRSKNYKKPIIGLTAHAMKEDIKKCFEAGADEVLTKPIDKIKLLETLHHYSSLNKA